MHTCAWSLVHTCAHVCSFVHKCAQTCTREHKYAHVCTNMHTYAPVCTSTHKREKTTPNPPTMVRCQNLSGSVNPLESKGYNDHVRGKPELDGVEIQSSSCSPTDNKVTSLESKEYNDHVRGEPSLDGVEIKSSSCNPLGVCHTHIKQAGERTRRPLLTHIVGFVREVAGSFARPKTTPNPPTLVQCRWMTTTARRPRQLQQRRNAD